MAVVKCEFFPPPSPTKPTSTDIGTRFIPASPEKLIFVPKPAFNKELLKVDKCVKDEGFKSTSRSTYTDKLYEFQKFQRPPSFNKFNYIRPVEAKMIGMLVPPPGPKISETKKKFKMNYSNFDHDHIEAPAIKCRLLPSRYGAEQQSQLPVNENGLFKYLDIYMTTNRLEYPQINIKHPLLDPMVSFRNQDEFLLPPKCGNPEIYDLVMFPKGVLPNRCFSRGPPAVPSGYTTENRDNYKRTPPYPTDHCIEVRDCFKYPGRFQTCCAPGMYCSEYCNYGRAAVRATVDTDKKLHEHVVRNCHPYVYER